MNRRHTHKPYSEKVYQSAGHQDGGHKGCKWQEIEQNVTWAAVHTAPDNNAHLLNTKTHSNTETVYRPCHYCLKHHPHTHTDPTRWPAWSNGLGLAVGFDRAEVRGPCSEEGHNEGQLSCQ